MRFAGVAIAICSWIAISNHCAFAALAADPSLANACPFHAKPAKEQQQSSQVQCCKVLRAFILAQGKSWARDDTKFADVDLDSEQLAIIAVFCNATEPLLLDIGPPRSHSFAELILQRSLLTHAPPLA